MIRALAVIALLLWGGAAHAQVMATGAGTGSAFNGCVPVNTIPVAVNGNNNTATGSTTVDVPAGSTVVVFVNEAGAFNTTFTSLTDSAGNTYTLQQPAATATNVQAAVGYNTNVVHIPVGSSFTAVNAAGSVWGLKAAFISCSTGIPDQVVTLNQPTANNGVTLTTGTLASNTETAYAYSFTNSAGGTVVTVPGGYHTLQNNGTNAIAYETTISTAPVTWNPTFTNSATSSNILITFQQTATVGGCPAYTALAARLDGSQNVGAVQALICGLVTDGTYSLLDLLYVGATNSLANSEKNWAQNAFNLTQHGTVTFSANNGWTGDGTTGYFDTGYVPATNAVQLTQNSGSLAICDVTNRTAAGSAVQIGASDNTNFLELIILFSAGAGGSFWDVNDNGNDTTTTTTSMGSWIASRTGSTTKTLYRNSGSFATSTNASTGLTGSSNNLVFLAQNRSNTIGRWTTDQISYVFVGAGLTQAQVSSVFSRLKTYMVAVGSSVSCDGGPVVTAGASPTYNPGGAAIQADSALNVTDVGLTNLSSASVSITAGFFAGDQLGFANQNGIAGSYNASTGVLTLTGSSSIPNYKTALQSITYSSTASDPTNGGANPSRTITWVVTE